METNEHHPLKTLVLFAHPDLSASVVNSQMIKAIDSLDHVTVHDLYATYPDFFIDADFEQQLLLKHDLIVFQHPLMMYSSPSLLKEWADRVIGKGFSFSKDDGLTGKYFCSVITTGGAPEAFSAGGFNGHTIDEVLLPFQLTVQLCGMVWLPPMIFYWARKASQNEVNAHAENYRRLLLNPLG